ncbi:hypothetical protein [Cryobacterium sp. TMT3-29-2]|uniref:hypothetical protein n=1 Tax=Cryobacterium sp. TMT3-29-2 TaxID=2555867 RepID=UPI00107487F3|nr:hypothetical protein [Cryobacterium sp. TMT3-29-2]TFC87144.1 hypothetical protein E3O67_09730 [Cryobacterium sp. TMT3-29-2]
MRVQRSWTACLATVVLTFALAACTSLSPEEKYDKAVGSDRILSQMDPSLVRESADDICSLLTGGSKLGEVREVFESGGIAEMEVSRLFRVTSNICPDYKDVLLGLAPG